MSKVVIFPNELLLSDVVRHADGSIHTGFVENGGWYFKRESGTQQSWSGSKKVHAWPDHAIQEVPAGKRGDYNKIISDARQRLGAV